MQQIPPDQIDAVTNSSVRAKVTQVLAQFASGAEHGPIPIGLLFLRICDELSVAGTIPARPNGDKFASLKYSHHTDSFPDFGAPPEMARLVRQVLWEYYQEGILTPSPRARQVRSKITQNPDFVPLAFLLDFDHALVTPYGVDILTDTANRIQVHDPDGYLANFRDADPPPDPEMLRYLEESVAVFRGGHFLATVVLLGTASERLIDVLGEGLHDALQDLQWFSRYSRQRDISKRFKSLTGKLMGEYGQDLDDAKLKDAFNGVVSLTFEQIRCARNDIVHPKGRQFKWNEVSGFLHNFVQYFEYVNQIIALLQRDTKGERR
jgi:hypothetical protein